MYKESAFPAVCVHCEKMVASCNHPVGCGKVNCRTLRYTFIVILKRRNKVNQYPLLPPRTLHSFYCLYRQDLLY